MIKKFLGICYQISKVASDSYVPDAGHSHAAGAVEAAASSAGASDTAVSTAGASGAAASSAGASEASEAAASGAGVSDAATSSLFLLAAAALVVVSSEAAAAAVELSADVDASDPGQLQTGEEAGIHEYNKIKKSMF